MKSSKEAFPFPYSNNIIIKKINTLEILSNSSIKNMFECFNTMYSRII